MYIRDNLNNNYMLDFRNFKIGIYLRLSKADDKEEILDPSESIKNQREYISKYVVNNGGFIIEEYVDDGYTGTNFNRPNFLRMLEDIKIGKINLVIVKDLSRLGRNYVYTGFYIEEIFPQHNTRFISINDGIDTFNKTNNNNELSGFKGILNDMYSADISKKIRSSFNTKRINGEFIGAFAPYGYKKDTTNKNKLVIDDEASLIVKRIFSMRISGIGIQKIMRILNAENIPCPTKYKQLKGSTYKNANISLYLWRAETIKAILTNPVYIGNMAQRRCEKISYKIAKHRKIPRKDWIIVENMHEPIIDKKTFYNVQELVNRKAFGQTDKKTEHLLGGLLICGDCGRTMTFRRRIVKGEKKFVTLCSSNSRFAECKPHSILEESLDELIQTDLRRISRKAIKNKELFFQQIHKPQFKEGNNIEKIIVSKNNRLKEIGTLTKSLYEDWKKEIISKDDFDNMYQSYNQEKSQLSNEITNLKNILDTNTKLIENTDFLNLLNQILNFENVPKQILVKLIDKIEIFQNKSVKIHYKFQSL